MVCLTFDKSFEVKSKFSQDYPAQTGMIEVSWIKEKNYFFALLANYDTMDKLYLKLILKSSSVIQSYNKSSAEMISDISPFKDDSTILWVYSKAMIMINASDQNNITSDIIYELDSDEGYLRKVECHRGEPNTNYSNIFATYQQKDTIKEITF